MHSGTPALKVTAAVGVDSVGDPSVKSARHATSVPLYSDLAGMVSVCTKAPFSLIEPVVMSGNCTSDDPFTLQPMIPSGDV